MASQRAIKKAAYSIKSNFIIATILAVLFISTGTAGAGSSTKDGTHHANEYKTPIPQTREQSNDAAYRSHLISSMGELQRNRQYLHDLHTFSNIESVTIPAGVVSTVKTMELFDTNYDRITRSSSNTP